MAYEKLSEKKIIATNLESFIQSQIQLISQSRLRRNLEDEARFNRAVLEDNLTLEQQLDYRKEQLKRTLKGDKDEKRRIRKEISALKDQIEQKAYNDEYIKQVMAMNQGMQSADRTIKWLENKLKKTTDQNIIKTIKDNLTSLYSIRYENRKKALASQTEFAKNDKTEEVINKQIDNINNERVRAINSGNDDYVALLDLQLQSLRKAANETHIQRSLLQFSVATMTGQTAITLLDQFNAQMENADDEIAVTIGGVTYDNAKQFWELKRADFINDHSENGFFKRYRNELDEQVNYKASRGVLTNNSLADVKNWYEEIKDRPELTEYQDRLAKEQQTALQSAADLRAQNILNEFAVKLDTKKALSDLSYIQDTYGVDQTLNYQKLITSAAKEKQDQINGILSMMSSILSKNPGITNQQAMEMAISSGAGAMLTPEELATQKASDLVSGMGDKATAQQFGEDSSITAPGVSSFSSPNLKEGDLVKMPNSNSVYINEGGKLRNFAGNWSEDQFKQYTGKTFDQVKTVKNISGLPQGEAITPDAQTPVKPSVGERVIHPDLLQYYKPQDIITKGKDKFLKPGVNPIWGKKIGYTEWKNMQTQYDPKKLESMVVRAGNDIYYKQ